jgi:hypothetical protein
MKRQTGLHVLLVCSLCSALAASTSQKSAAAEPPVDAPTAAPGGAESPWTLTLQRSLPGSDSADKGALFAYSDAGGGEDAVLSADFFLALSTPFTNISGGRGRKDRYRFQVSLEGHLATGRDEGEQAQDALRARAGFDFLFRDVAVADALRIKASLVYEADQDLDVEKGIVEVLATAVIPAVYMGKSGSSKSYFGFSWEPWIGVDLGKTLDEDREDQVEEDTIVRLKALVSAQFSLLDFVNLGKNAEDPKRKEFLIGGGKGFSIRDVVFFVEDNFYYLPNDDGDTFNLVTVGIDLKFTDSIGLQISYSDGADAPKFEDGHIFKIGLSAKF